MPSRGLGGRARRRRACRRRRDAVARDWAGGLGTDTLLDIFLWLDHIDVLLAADNVCRSWRRAAREEPTLWRRITMRGNEGMARRLNRGGMACEAVRRAAGQCEAFCGEYAGDDGFLMYLIEQAPCLKTLRLISCNYVSHEGFTEAVQELPLLEDLEISLCGNVGGDYEVGFDVNRPLLEDLKISLCGNVGGDYENRFDVNRSFFKFVGDVCRKLKHFRQSNKLFDVRKWQDKDVRGIATMHGLHSLQLFGHGLTNEGLETILNNCPHLECLDIRHCFNVDMDEALRLKCARIKTLRLPNDPTDDYDRKVHSPITTDMLVEEEIVWDSDDYYTLHDYSDDSGDDSDFFGEPSRYESDLDKYEKMLPLSMRTFLNH